jgi:O-antigen ligase
MIFEKKKIYEYFIILLILTLSFSIALPNIVLGVLVFIFLISLYYKRVIIEKKHYKNFFFFFLVYLVIIKSLNHVIFDELSSFSRFLIIVMIPVLFYQTPKNKIIISFISAVLLAIFIASIRIGLFYLSNNSLPFSNNSEVNNLLFIERPYMGFVCLINTLLSFYMIKEIPKYKHFFLLISLLSSFFIFFIVARLSIITIVFLLITLLFFYLPLSLFKKGLIFFLGASIIFIALFNYKNLTNRFFLKANLETIKDYEPRLVIWPCTVEIIHLNDFNMFFGAKSNKWIESQLTQCYSNKIENTSKKEWFVKSRFNSHSQFIDVFLEGGIIGLIFFLFFIFHLLIYSRTNFYTFAIVFSIILFFMLENVLYRQFGCYVLAILFSIIEKIKNEEN